MCLRTKIRAAALPQTIVFFLLEVRLSHAHRRRADGKAAQSVTGRSEMHVENTCVAAAPKCVTLCRNAAHIVGGRTENT